MKVIHRRNGKQINTKNIIKVNYLLLRTRIINSDLIQLLNWLFLYYNNSSRLRFNYIFLIYIQPPICLNNQDILLLMATAIDTSKNMTENEMSYKIINTNYLTKEWWCTRFTTNKDNVGIILKI